MPASSATASATSALTCIDDVSMQAVHAVHRYNDEQIWDRSSLHFADTPVTLDNGELVVDMTKLDDVVPDPATRDSVRA